MRSKAIKTPALIVALGTTASKSTRELCEHMLSMEQDDRDAVAIVTIDTDTARPEFRDLLADNPGKFHAYHVAIRVPPNVDQADNLDRMTRSQVFLPHYTPHYYDYGAGGIRNHGHVALAFQLDKLQTALQDALAAIKLLPMGQGHRVTDSVQVYVVGFLGGGTGSGIVADVGVIVRNLLMTELQGQRLLLFGILPNDRMPGSGYNEESWRKSNATAALLEVMATGMAASGTPDKVYRKRILKRLYNVTEGPIFNEMYVVGKTNLNNVDLIAEMVGLDLFQRITDGSGIGDRERSQSPDFKDLKVKDDRQLYTNFSASCPIEIRFPAREVSDAFARMAAGRLLQLPDFVGEVPPEYSPAPDDQSAWETKWDGYAIPAIVGEGGSGDAALLAPPLLAFQASQFIGTASTRRNILWAQATDAIRRFPALLETLRRRIEQREMDALTEVPDVDPDNPLVSYNARRLTHISRQRQEYDYALNLFETFPIDLPEGTRPIDLENRMEQLLPLGLDRVLPGPIRDPIEQGRAQSVADAYSGVIEDAFYFQRHSMLKDLLKQLKQRADELYESGKRDIVDANAIEAGKEFVRQGERSMIWQGQLGREHPHQIGLFSINAFKRTQKQRGLDKLPAMIGLFRWATDSTDGNALSDCSKLDIASFDKVLRSETWMGACQRYLNDARRRDSADMADANLSEAEMRNALAVDAARMPERVLEFFTQRYREIFQEQNLIDLLAIGYAAETGRSRGHAWRENVGDLLHEHLDHANNILREMVGSDPSLWLDGSRTVRRTLYLGINWRANTSERSMIEAAARSVSFEGKVDSPQIDRDLDPHRLQLNYASHALSIRTMPMFFMRNNSLTSEYMNYERAWRSGWSATGRQEAPTSPIGSGRVAGMVPGMQPGAMGSDPGNGAQSQQTAYGMGGLPVHSCEEMEKLTLSADALPNPWRINLVQRILRDFALAPQEPNWNLRDMGDDDEFFGDSGGWNGGNNGGNGSNGGNGGGHYGGSGWERGQ